MRTRIKIIGTVTIFALLLFAMISRNGSALPQIPQNAATVPSVIEKDGKEIEFNTKKDKVTVQSFFDVSWSDPFNGDESSESVNVTLQDLAYDDYNQSIDMSQNGDTKLMANENELISFGLNGINNTQMVSGMIGLEDNATDNSHDINFAEFAHLDTQMTVGMFNYSHGDLLNDPNWLHIAICESAYGNIKGLLVQYHIHAEGVDTVIMWQNNTAEALGGFFYPFDRLLMFGGFYNLTVEWGTILFAGIDFSITLDCESGSAMVILREHPVVEWQTIMVLNLHNLWLWEIGTVEVELKTLAGSMYITYYNAWLADYYGLFYLFVWDAYDIKIECFWNNYFYVVFNWYWITLVWWYWECSIYWEAKIVINEWIIEWTLFWDIALTQWNWWFWVYYCCWKLPFVVFEVPLITIQPIVSISIVNEIYDAAADQLNLTYRLTDFYGKEVNNADVDVAVDNVTVRATALGNGLYKVTHNQSAKIDAWTVQVNASVPEVALVEQLNYALDVDEVTCLTCDECEDCPVCPTWDSTKTGLTVATVGGFSLATLIGIFGRRSSLICPPK